MRRFSAAWSALGSRRQRNLCITLTLITLILAFPQGSQRLLGSWPTPTFAVLMLTYNAWPTVWGLLWNLPFDKVTQMEKQLILVCATTLGVALLTAKLNLVQAQQVGTASIIELLLATLLVAAFLRLKR